MIAFRFLLSSAVLFTTIAQATVPVAATDDPLDRYNVVWEKPSLDSSGSMPIGNGDIGVNTWVEQDGDLLLLISKTDAWSGIARLVKLGRMRVKLSPNPFVEGVRFRQTLKLRQGEIQIVAGPEESAAVIRVWVDANRPVIRVEATGEKLFEVQVALELWRNEPRELKGAEIHSAYGLAGGPDPIVVEPDTVVSGQNDRIVWYHRNETSIWEMTLKHQGLSGFTAGATDPLLHRTFGGCIQGEGLVRDTPTSLISAAPGRRFAISVYPLTAQTATSDQWAEQLDRIAAGVDAVALDEARADHQRWWDRFWNRSWIRIKSSESIVPSLCKGRKLVRNKLPLRIGADSNGQNRFVGEMDRVTVYERALSDEEIARNAQGNAPPPGQAAGCVGDWLFDEMADGTAESAAPGKLQAKVVGDIELVDGRPGSSGKAVRLTGRGYLEVPHCDALDLEDAVTVEAWIRPQNTGGRIVDKTQAATATGYMIDTHPGNSLRLVLDDGNMQSDARLPVGRWMHVAGVFDAPSGRKELYVNGQRVASGTTTNRQDRDPAVTVTRGYTLQRWINACGGRGAFPIKFNGSIFTVDTRFDADYRAWGGPYWWQNTRLPYWPMLACGDFDMMRPMFRMYQESLPLAEHRSRVWFGHRGAFLPETMYFWGSHNNTNYGWDRKGRHVSDVVNRYIRREYTSSPELLAMMLDYYAFTRDIVFLQDSLLPTADSLLAFWDQHYRRDAKGRLHMEPAQALETLQNAVNPTPDIAGLHWVLGKLVQLPEHEVTAKRQEFWSQLATDIPPLPMGEIEGHRYVLGAEKILGGRGNSENPELYTVFPFRIFGVGKPDLDVGRLTFERRSAKGNNGWRQDDTQAALLGLTDTAVRYLSGRAANKHPESRFPAFWGPNMDWIPDQDHGGNLMMTVQTMLIQTEDAKILLLPAWPNGWNVEFKLHAPHNTTIEGVYRDGKMQSLRVTPEERAGDVVQMDPQA